jgi:hypothetical protein
MAFVVDNGYEKSADPSEFYLDGPEAEAPRTEVFVPCREVEPRQDDGR